MFRQFLLWGAVLLSACAGFIHAMAQKPTLPPQSLLRNTNASEFVAVAPNDRFAATVTQALFHDFQQLLQHVFAVAGGQVTLTVEWAPDASTGSTMKFRLTSLMSMHFNSTLFTGLSYPTVVQTEYWCDVTYVPRLNKKTQKRVLNCRLQDIQELKRIVIPTDNVQAYLLNAVDDRLRHRFDDETMNMTDAEVQLLNGADNYMGFYKWTVNGQPVPCTASFLHNTTHSTLVMLDDTCYIVKYPSILPRRMRTSSLIMISTAIFGALGVIVLTLFRRNALPSSTSFKTLRFMRPVGTNANVA